MPFLESLRGTKDPKSTEMAFYFFFLFHFFASLFTPFLLVLSLFQSLVFFLSLLAERERVPIGYYKCHSRRTDGIHIRKDRERERTD